MILNIMNKINVICFIQIHMKKKMIFNFNLNDKLIMLL